jgi:hypothetical protein
MNLNLKIENNFQIQNKKNIKEKIFFLLSTGTKYQKQIFIV